VSSIILGVIDETCSLNYHLKSLDPQSDNLSNYLSWMKDTKNNRFIESANNQFTHQDLVSYVDNKNKSDNAILFGIFSKLDGFHIGNVKLEPLVISQFAWLGILIGEEKFRGRGTGFEVISHLLHFSRRNLDLKKIYLGVHKDNVPAVRLYKKLGFIEIPSDSGKFNSISMRFDFI
jgi:ribosomal-protein-alanine N-acetyltransferase